MNNSFIPQASKLIHPFGPVFNKHSRVLVLGSFPSVISRENAFYYGHPQNRFWRLLAALFGTAVPETIAEKTEFLLLHRIALWDVAAACTITGSADSTLVSLEYNDIPSLVQKTEIRYIFANGQKAGHLFRTHLELQTGLPIQILPSTSPANAAWSLQRLMTGWRALVEALPNTQDIVQ
ncbi:MAG TPA: DNA-deoxyinosine glycosylase [Candidatus Limiplasma sp.]|nr:DNA-deoxyinosine glycosylase [Candidatus Limiplasma sp.]HRX09465.1 DNA-deoxyinosine glycosylase [Candidatus Limiplasma sp.]